jgi:hypothetical protein
MQGRGEAKTMATDEGSDRGTTPGSSQEHPLDALTRGMASRTLSRGRALQLVSAAILGGSGLPALFSRLAGAQSTASEPTVASGFEGSPIQASDAGCRAGPAIDNHRCPENQCRGRLDCFCATTAGGDKVCASIGFEKVCPNRDQCDGNRDCPRGELCIQIGGCCGHPHRNLCVAPCP